jgi:hypothetical protein
LYKTGISLEEEEEEEHENRKLKPSTGRVVHGSLSSVDASELPRTDDH